MKREKNSKKLFPNLGIGTVVGAILIAFVIMSFAMPASAGLATQDLNTLTPNDLANSLLGSGVTVNSVGYTGANVAAGTFTGGTGIIGIEGGIILSSGNIKNVIGPNVQDGITGDNGLPGDADLQALIPGYYTYDASALNIKFTPTGSVLVFKYVFASDEYNEYANSNFNDVFGFFLNGNNVALLPGTTTVVSINNVNGGKPYGTNAQNPEYYINNDLNDGGATINTEMDGLTKVLTVTANVNPGVENTIKLAIADSGDRILDSNVFLEGGSFKSPQLTLTPLTATAYTGTSQSKTAKLVDSDGNPTAGVTITFTITGPNAQTATGTTDANGESTLTYTGANVGTDKVVATGGGQTSNDAYVIWEPSPNQPPVAEAGGPYEVNEGSPVTLNGDGSTDPDGDTLAFAWDLDNDGIFETPGNTNVITPPDGPKTLTVGLQVDDGKGGVSTDTATVTVNNVAPVVGPLTVPIDPQPISNATSVSAPFTDAGVLDTHTVSIDWDDGSMASAGTVTESGGSGTAAGSHTYSTPGIYTISMTVTDKDGGSATVVATQYVVVYGPGFVTGGGTIESPLGAYVPDPTLSGKANFGFVAKYQKGATVPTGVTEFQFHAGGMNFHSESYNWLLVNNQKAMYRGIGHINNNPEQYKFLVSAIDSNTGDKFRMKITDMSDNVVYDNQLGAIDDADPSTLISGGSIVIHNKK